MRHLDLFSGIGGFSLAGSRVWSDHEVVSFCEIEPFAQKVLKKHWPDVPCHDDIKTMKGSDYADIDLLTGGFPCQPYSQAGQRRGSEDDRHLWPEMLRIIREVKPKWVVGENVRGLTNWNGGVVFDEVLSDLEAEGYSVQSFLLPACAVDAPHRRDRIWIIANSLHPRLYQEKEHTAERGIDALGRSGGLCEDVVNADSHGLIEHPKSKKAKSKRRTEATTMPRSENVDDTSSKRRDEVELHGGAERQGTKSFTREYIGASLSDRIEGWEQRWLPEPNVGRVANGIPNRVDRLKGLGNAIVPQIAEMIFRAIKEYES